MGIIVYNRTKEDHSSNPNNFPIYRPSILGNPYTDIKERNTKAQYVVRNRDEALERYSDYYDVMYGSNLEFTREIDKIYEKYKTGQDVYLECYCKKYVSSERNNENDILCHGDIIADKLRNRLIKEKLNNR